jgi:hypothetical protein
MWCHVNIRLLAVLCAELSMLYCACRYHHPLSAGPGQAHAYDMWSAGVVMVRAKHRSKTLKLLKVAVDARLVCRICPPHSPSKAELIWSPSRA